MIICKLFPGNPLGRPFVRPFFENLSRSPDRAQAIEKGCRKSFGGKEIGGGSDPVRDAERR